MAQPFGSLSPGDNDPNGLMGSGYGSDVPLLDVETARRLAAGVAGSWPGRMLSDAAAALKTVGDGGYQPGLRREDVTDIPPPSEPTADSTILGRALKMAPVGWEPNDKYIQASTDLAATVAGIGAPAAEKGALGAAGGRMPAAPAAASAAETVAPPFYSAVEKAVTDSPLNKSVGQQWLGTIKNTPGVKPDEISALGLDKFLTDQKGAVTKQDVLDHIAANKVQVGEVDKGGAGPIDYSNYHGRSVAEIDQDMDANAALAFGDNPEFKDRPDLLARHEELQTERNAARNAADNWQPEYPETKFGTYVLPGGENYREKLLTLPETPSKFDPSQVEIKRNMQSTTQGSTSIWYGGKKVATYSDDPALQPGGSYDQRPQSYWMGVAQKLYDKGDQINKIPSRSENFTSSHWDEPNVLAHIRMNDRMIPNVEGGADKSLHLEEIQSDWHQKGRASGYQNPNPTYSLEGNGPWTIRDQNNRFISDFNNRDTAQTHLDDLNAGRVKADQVGVPDAPFKTTWPELAFKRALRDAAEGGYDRLSWTPGEAQAARYDLSKQISRLQWEKSGTSGFTPLDAIEHRVEGVPVRGTIRAFDHSGREVINKIATEDELPDIIGKDTAQKLLDQQPQSGRNAGTALSMRKLEGVDLKVGGEGMKGFYDQMLPKMANKLVKPFGSKVEQVNMDIGAGKPADMRNALDTTQVHSLKITPELRKAAMTKGFPLFSAGAVAAPVFGSMAPGSDTGQ
jgi:hypothetical protein